MATDGNKKDSNSRAGTRSGVRADLSWPSAPARSAAAAGWYWLNGQPLDDEIPAPLRKVLGVNERVVRNALYSNNNLAKRYPASAIGKIKVNGDIGIEKPHRPRRLEPDAGAVWFSREETETCGRPDPCRATKRSSISNAWKAGVP